MSQTLFEQPAEPDQAPVKPPATAADVNKVMPVLQRFIGQRQLKVLATNANRGEERQFFRDMLVELAAKIEAMPKTYEQDGLGKKAIVHLHYFNSSSDWWITEKDAGCDDDPPQERGVQHQAFGFACLNGDTVNADLGYISIAELIENHVELDLYWTLKTLAEVKAKQQIID